jgi:hypothetical protein
VKIITKNSTGLLDSTNEWYPSVAVVVQDAEWQTLAHSTTFGVVLSGKSYVNDRAIYPNEFFCLPSTEHQTISVDGRAALFVRLGFLGQHIVAGKIDPKGRVSYIDGCTDSVLVYPPRKGDACLNKLSDSDWTQISDTPLSQEQKQEWADYRQALRDLPQTFESADQVTWPVPPGQIQETP